MSTQRETHPAARINPHAVQVMQEVGIDISAGVPKSVNQFVSNNSAVAVVTRFAFVILVIRRRYVLNVPIPVTTRHSTPARILAIDVARGKKLPQSGD